MGAKGPLKHGFGLVKVHYGTFLFRLPLIGSDRVMVMSVISSCALLWFSNTHAGESEAIAPLLESRSEPDTY